LGTEAQVNAAFQRFKELADRKHEIFDEDLHALVSDESMSPDTELYSLIALRAHSETGEEPQARITMRVGSEEHVQESTGSGPVDAAFKAIEKIAPSGTELQLYSVNAITSGTESQGEVTVRLSLGDRVVNGLGADTDIVVASAKAYLNALNKLHHGAAKLNPQA